MKLSVTSVFLVLAYASASVLAQTYTQTSSAVGSAFTFEAIADPTAGFVIYGDEATAQSAGLVSSTSFTFTLDPACILSSHSYENRH
ncbi:glycoside hydrolase family 16 protein [Athelia psychrophila]|uniref:Glycoside hydrolase family 16 protein n=1 Tax=Athelia psychrophila TaxID=1759441 RepID=A0A166QEI8_9AGAM|nr:glycoside hydrolase family 16 protein [Fibularhizoctonia sp. CBS 109695]